MKATKKILAITLVLVMTALCFASCGKKNDVWKTTEDGKVILEIGFTGPLTGEYANYGISVRDGAKLAVEEINAKGGVNGFELKLLEADSGGSGEKAVQGYGKLIDDGMIGRVENINISSLHGYHGVSIIRRYLGVGYGNCTIYGKRYRYDVTETYGREGMCFDGEIFSCPRDRLTFEFDNGTTAFFDFSDPAQYHSFIRTRQLTVQGVRGEIDDMTIRYLTNENVPVTAQLNRIDLGVYGNQEWSHFAIMLGEKFLYRSPFVNARMNDDEIAVASCLAGMKHYIETGEECYSLRDALQDMYLCLKMDEALANPLKPITTETMPWAE